MTSVKYRGDSETRQVVVDTGESTEPLPHHVLHSPDGFEWGYAGSGPAELARCLLIHALGDPDPEPAMYQQFKFDKIANMPPNVDWLISQVFIKAWAAAVSPAQARWVMSLVRSAKVGFVIDRGVGPRDWENT